MTGEHLDAIAGPRLRPVPFSPERRGSLGHPGDNRQTNDNPYWVFVDDDTEKEFAIAKSEIILMSPTSDALAAFEGSNHADAYQPTLTTRIRGDLSRCVIDPNKFLFIPR